MLTMICATLSDPDERQFMTNLFIAVEKLMYKTASRYAGQADCEDIVQDSLEKLLRKADVLMGMDRKAQIQYVVNTIRNTAISRLRKAKAWGGPPESMDDNDFVEPESTGPSPDELLCATENQQAFRAAWKTLSTKERTLLEQKYLLKLSDAELAKIYHCQQNSMRMKLSRARKSVYKFLSREGVEFYDTPRRIDAEL